MDISWSYYLIAVLYVMIIFLRFINHIKEDKYVDNHKGSKSVFAIKLDFFVTVGIFCTLIALGINISSIMGGRGLQVPSIFIALLVNGFVVLNSFVQVLFNEESDTIFYSGYVIGKDDISSLKVKKGTQWYSMNFNFEKEIESYNSAKILVFGKEKRHFGRFAQNLVKETK